MAAKYETRAVDVEHWQILQQIQQADVDDRDCAADQGEAQKGCPRTARSGNAQDQIGVILSGDSGSRSSGREHLQL
jgi:hypothetical protein